LGSQVGYAYQNRQAYFQEKQAESINQRGREFVAMRIMTFVAERFDKGEKPPTRLQLSERLGIPSQLACDVLCALAGADLLVEVQGEETSYTPGRPIGKITVEDILSAMRVGQGTEVATSDDSSRAVVRREYDRVFLAEMQAAAGVTLQDLVRRVESAVVPPIGNAPAALEPAAVRV
jgi:membrane protein